MALPPLWPTIPKARDREYRVEIIFTTYTKTPTPQTREIISPKGNKDFPNHKRNMLTHFECQYSSPTVANHPNEETSSDRTCSSSSRRQRDFEHNCSEVEPALAACQRPGLCHLSGMANFHGGCVLALQTISDLHERTHRRNALLWTLENEAPQEAYQQHISEKYIRDIYIFPRDPEAASRHLNPPSWTKRLNNSSHWHRNIGAVKFQKLYREYQKIEKQAARKSQDQTSDGKLQEQTSNRFAILDTPIGPTYTADAMTHGLEDDIVEKYVKHAKNYTNDCGREALASRICDVE
ncbi:uncharacterized protein PAC_11678 [Phialocephala subalpina]|uniref:Uncharacterized protein n=1 Tax=Phialocephala subalpina TaxID=576137 RepID=A0A1L7X9T1_9HELO|nr:uncharacterized protein PAC_11678 [Phialocephala subalpina]